jgi:hypothetical protein
MSKEKVYCKGCENLRKRQDRLPVYYECFHESNLKITDDWLTTHKESIRPPREINSNNDCKNYEEMED